MDVRCPSNAQGHKYDRLGGGIFQCRHCKKKTKYNDFKKEWEEVS